MGRTNGWVAALAACALACAAAATAREAPAPGCIDLRALDGGWRTGEHELVLRGPDESGVRLSLDPTCTPFAQGEDLATLGPDGWACPGEALYVHDGTTACPVAQMTPLSATDVATALEVREAQLAVDLDRVVVEGRRRWNDIVGTTDRCVDARFLRGWEIRDGELVVEVLPGRHSGHRYYRVETVEACTGLANAHMVKVKSRSGGAAVCGRPGDRVVLYGYGVSDLVPMGGPTAAAAGGSCEIRRVTPLPRG